MPKIPQPYDHLDHIGSIPDGAQGQPSQSDTTILDGDYRNAPGADTFWHQNRRAYNTDGEPNVT